MEGHIMIFDTTLRDGEQSPGCTMNLKEKILLAKQLEKLGVDIIEAGFPAASDGDFEAVKAIALEIKKATICGLSRALETDILRTWEAVKDAENPRIHTFIATSEVHMKYKLKMSEDEVFNRSVAMVKYARSLCEEVEFSAEDASRTEIKFLARVVEGVIDAGAKIVNIPDTVGYTTPNEMYKIIEYLKQNVSNIDNAVISVHCHNDLGMAVSNSLSAILAGARQVECTINGIGERAGNAALEEIVMALKTRKDYYQYDTDVISKEISKSSKLLTAITGISVQPNKAIVGANAFSHEAGIHQHGVLANKATYEIMSPESIGLKSNKMVLGKHSGRHSFAKRLENLGFNLSDGKVDVAFVKFKKLADNKKTVYDRDIIAIAMEEAVKTPELFSLKSFAINTGTLVSSTATIVLESKGKMYEEVAIGDGPVDASYNAIKKIMGIEATLMEYKLNAVTEGMDAQGEAMVKVKSNDEIYKGHGLSTDVIKSSIEAYLAAMNRIREKQEELKWEKH
ncbi:MAG: 2-isopropylmalate synthase [Clostridiales bacterium]|nr:2-isopropylmalate synthase [Clostridiales bacterium]